MSWWSPSQQGEPTDLTQGRWGRGPRSVQNIPGQLPPKVEQKRSAHVVNEEGILGATGRMAQDEALDEPGGGGSTWVEVRSLVADRPHTLPCSPCVAPSAHRRMVCAAHFLLAAFLRPSVPRHHDWMQVAVETTNG